MPSSIEQLIALVKALKDQVAELKTARDTDTAKILSLKTEVDNLKKQMLFVQGRLSINPATQQHVKAPAKEEPKPAPAQAPQPTATIDKPEGPQK